MRLKIVILLLLQLGTTIKCRTETDKLTKNERKIVVNLKTFRNQNLICHNNHRKKHGVQSAEESQELNDFAQSYAELLAEKDAGLVHSKEGYGENLMSSNSLVDGYTACNGWYRQEEKYNYTLSGSQPGTGHFTQLVWKETCTIGVGAATSNSGVTYVVNNYYPHGNVHGRYRENVLPLGTKLKSKQDLGPYELDDHFLCNPNQEQILEDNLECHNKLRARHCVPPLKYSSQMNEYALEKAQIMADANNFLSLHEYEGIVIKYSGIKNTGFCREWYSKGKETYNYTLGKTSNSDEKYFAFITWKNTNYTGFAVAHTKNNETYVVSIYDPPGNVKGQYIENVKPECVIKQGSIFIKSSATQTMINVTIIFLLQLYIVGM